jgi:hypothetical protein
MNDKSKAIINQLYSYYNVKQEDGEWQLEGVPMRESNIHGLALTTIADNLGKLVQQLRLPAGEWIEVTPETLPEPFTVCVMFMAKGGRIFALGALNVKGEWRFHNYTGTTPEPLYYLPIPRLTQEMNERWEAEVEAAATDGDL